MTDERIRVALTAGIVLASVLVVYNLVTLVEALRP